jgi:hypothetical protein
MGEQFTSSSRRAKVTGRRRGDGISPGKEVESVDPWACYHAVTPMTPAGYRARSSFILETTPMKEGSMKAFVITSTLALPALGLGWRTGAGRSARRAGGWDERPDEDDGQPAGQDRRWRRSNHNLKQTHRPRNQNQISSAPVRPDTRARVSVRKSLLRSASTRLSRGEGPMLFVRPTVLAASMALVGLVPALVPVKAMAEQHWGSYKPDQCTQPGKRQYSSILWDIPWGADWKTACQSTPGTPANIAARVPDRCANVLNEWGEWDVDDGACAGGGGGPPPGPPHPIPK